MTSPEVMSKIQPTHLVRLAIVYVRQSTEYQVKHNTGSTELQRAMREKALAYGWPITNIKVDTTDLARSATTTKGRNGFKWMCDEIYAGRVGAVFYTDTMRLSRDCGDLIHLIKLCDLAGTLFIEGQGVYDPKNNNDRLLLSVKALLGENDGRERTRTLNAMKLKKAELGELRVRLPVGFVYNGAGKVILDPNEEVQGKVRQAFELFEEKGSAWSVVKHFTGNGLTFPYYINGGPRHGELDYGKLCVSRLASILNNPAYAGAMVYGRTEQVPIQKTSDDGSTTWSTSTRHRKRKDWLVVKYDAHPGYISGTQYEKNIQQLKDNQFRWDEAHPGAVRSGSALLQGIAFCGKCGRRMRVKYSGKRALADYSCCQAQVSYSLPKCQSFPSAEVDNAIVRQFLKAVEPGQIEISLRALEQLDEQVSKSEKNWEASLRKAQKAAEQVRRLLNMCDEQQNQLAYLELFTEWNGNLVKVKEIEAERPQVATLASRLLDETERRSIEALAKDLPKFWQAETTTQIMRKQLLRLLIQDVTLTRFERTVTANIRWQTGACTTLTIPFRQYERNVVEIVRKLAEDHTDREIADHFNEQGFTPLRGEHYTDRTIHKIRWIHKISSGWSVQSIHCINGQRGDGRYTVSAASKLLKMPVWTIIKWCHNGRLDGVQAKPGSPWWVMLTPEVIAHLTAEVEGEGHFLPNISAESKLMTVAI